MTLRNPRTLPASSDSAIPAKQHKQNSNQRKQQQHIKHLSEKLTLSYRRKFELSFTCIKLHVVSVCLISKRFTWFYWPIWSKTSHWAIHIAIKNNILKSPFQRFNFFFKLYLFYNCETSFTTFINLTRRHVCSTSLQALSEQIVCI